MTLAPLSFAGGLFVPTNDRNPRFVHAFCASHCTHLGVTRSHRDVTLPHTASVQVEQLPKDVRRAKCNVCSRKGVRQRTTPGSSL